MATELGGRASVEANVRLRKEVKAVEPLAAETLPLSVVYEVS